MRCFFFLIILCCSANYISAQQQKDSFVYGNACDGQTLVTYPLESGNCSFREYLFGRLVTTGFLTVSANNIDFKSDLNRFLDSFIVEYDADRKLLSKRLTHGGGMLEEWKYEGNKLASHTKMIGDLNDPTVVTDLFQNGVQVEKNTLTERGLLTIQPYKKGRKKGRKKIYTHAYDGWMQTTKKHKEIIEYHYTKEFKLHSIRYLKNYYTPLYTEYFNSNGKIQKIEKYGKNQKLIETYSYDPNSEVTSYWQMLDSIAKAGFSFKNIGGVSMLSGAMESIFPGTLKLTIKVSDNEVYEVTNAEKTLAINLYKYGKLVQKNLIGYDESYSVWFKYSAFTRPVSEIDTALIVHVLKVARQQYSTDDFPSEFNITNYYRDGTIQSIWNFSGYKNKRYEFDSGKTNYFPLTDKRLLIAKDLASCKYGVRDVSAGGIIWLIEPVYDVIEEYSPYHSMFSLDRILYTAIKGDSLYWIDGEGRILLKNLNKYSTKIYTLSNQQMKQFKTDCKYVVPEIHGFTGFILYDLNGEELYKYKKDSSTFQFFEEANGFIVQGSNGMGNKKWHSYNGGEWEIPLPDERVYTEINDGEILITDGHSPARPGHIICKNGTVFPNIHVSKINENEISGFADSFAFTYHIKTNKIDTLARFENGEELTNYLLEEYSRKQKIFTIELNKKVGLFDTKNMKLLLAPVYTSIQDNGVFSRNGKIGLLNAEKNREIMYGHKYIIEIPNAEYNYGAKYFYYTDSNEYFLIDNQGKALLSEPVDHIISSNGRLFLVKWNQILGNETEKLWPNYDHRNEPLIYYAKDQITGNYGIVGANRVVVPFEFTESSQEYNGSSNLLNRKYKYQVLVFNLKRNDTFFKYYSILNKLVAEKTLSNTQNKSGAKLGINSNGHIEIQSCNMNFVVPDSAKNISFDYMPQYVWFSTAKPKSSSDYGFSNNTWRVFNVSNGKVTANVYPQPNLSKIGNYYFIPNKNDAWEILDENFNQITKKTYQWIYKYSNSIILENKDKTYSFDKNTGKIMELEASNVVPISDGFIGIDKGIINLLNSDGQLIQADSNFMFGKRYLQNYFYGRGSASGLTVSLTKPPGFDTAMCLKSNFFCLWDLHNNLGYRFEQVSKSSGYNSPYPGEEYYLNQLKQKEINNDSENENGEVRLEEAGPSYDIGAGAINAVSEPDDPGYLKWIANFAKGPQPCKLSDFDNIALGWKGDGYRDFSHFVNIETYKMNYHLFFQNSGVVYKFDLHSLLNLDSFNAFNLFLYNKLKYYPELNFPCVLGSNFVRYFNSRFKINENELILFDSDKHEYSCRVEEILRFVKPEVIRLMFKK